MGTKDIAAPLSGNSRHDEGQQSRSILFTKNDRARLGVIAAKSAQRVTGAASFDLLADIRDQQPWAPQLKNQTRRCPRRSRRPARAPRDGEAHAPLNQSRSILARWLEQVPEEFKRGEDAKYLMSVAKRQVHHLVNLVYRPTSPGGASKEDEYSRKSIEERWLAGYRIPMTQNSAQWGQD
jgi:patatin-like phospholipase